MELRVNLVLFATLAVAWAAVTAAEPVAALDPAAQDTRDLAHLEDAFALARGDYELVRELSEAYLEHGRPGLAIATLRAAEPRLLEDPLLLHRLAQGYEASGRVDDANATAELALAKCARSLGGNDAPVGTAVPRYGCSARRYAMLSVHRSALARMVQWGIDDPAADPRTQLAYDLATRRVTLASAR